ncbi:chondroitin sulfate synthase 3-like [Zophobas morio]|uniref:chondroitin sulfate synthase 3-like n=1 Tax=Zophobas morio TaxID=2755281 RepID=UPI003082C3CB
MTVIASYCFNFNEVPVFRAVFKISIIDKSELVEIKGNVAVEASAKNFCLKRQEEAKLFIVLYQNDRSSDFLRSGALIEDVQRTYGSDAVVAIHTNETFSRARALELGLSLLSGDDLVLFMDVDMIFHPRSLQRVRQNTVKEKSVYFPIVYSLYNPRLLNRTYPDNYSFFSDDIVDEDSGFWRQFGFGIVSLYKSDYVGLGGLNLLISGWGFEDVTFYDNAIKSSLRIVRSVDPNLIHVYHSIECDINLDAAQKTTCLGTQANMLGSLKQLQKVYERYEEVIFFVHFFLKSIENPSEGILCSSPKKYLEHNNIPKFIPEVAAIKYGWHRTHGWLHSGVFVQYG